MRKTTIKTMVSRAKIVAITLSYFFNIGFTVYRTLQIFDMLSITRKHDFDDNRYRYELMLEKEDEHRHHHVVCKACGSIFEVKMDLLEDIENEISKKLDFEIADHDLVIYGTCSKCRNNIKKDDDMKEKVNKRVVK